MSLKQMQALEKGMNCKHDWQFVDGLTKRLRCQRCAALSFNLDLMDKEEDDEFARIEREQAMGWRKQHIEQKKELDPYRNIVLEEVALEFEKMLVLGDTAASFAAYVRGMKR
jgi:hypothetical protein